MSSVPPFVRSGKDAHVLSPAPIQQREPEVADGDQGYGTIQGAESDGLKLRYYVGVLLRRRWSALTAFVVVFTAVVVHNFTAVPLYEASARVLVEFEQLNPVVAQDVFGPSDPWRSLDPELAVLESRWLARRTVEALGLLVPEGEPTVDAGSETNDAAGDVSGAWAKDVVCGQNVRCEELWGRGASTGGFSLSRRVASSR